MVILHGILILEYIPPVSTLPAIGNLLEDVCRYVCWPVELSTRGVEVELVKDGHVLLSIEKLRTLVGVRPTYSTIIGDFNFTSLTLSGCNEDHTVCSTGTIDGGRCSILQHVDALDISGVNVIKATTCDTVDYIKRCRVTDGTDTTDVNLVTLTRLCRTLGDLYTRSAWLHSFECVGGVQLGDVLTLYLNRSTGHEFLFHRTITDNNHVVQRCVVFF